MAHRSRRRRDTSAIANDPLLPFLSPVSPSPLLSPLVSPVVLNEIEDRRQFHPLQVHRPPLTVDARPARLSRSFRASRFLRPDHLVADVLSFCSPQWVLRCIRRKVRKEMMHVIKHAGSGGGRKPKRDWFSKVSCK